MCGWERFLLSNFFHVSFQSVRGWGEDTFLLTNYSSDFGGRGYDNDHKDTSNHHHYHYHLRECAAEQRTSSWLRARVAKGLRAAPLRQFRRAKQSKADEFQDQAYP